MIRKTSGGRKNRRGFAVALLPLRPSRLPALLLPALAAAMLSAGCADSRRPPAAFAAHDAALQRAPHNILLGRSHATQQLAEEFAGRSNWPFVEHGYLFDDVTFFESYQYDRQSFYDRLGGQYDREATTVRSGVLLR